MVKLHLGFLVGFGYVWSLWFNQVDLHSSVVLLSLPLWLVLAGRAAGFYCLLLFLSFYIPRLRLWLLSWVRELVESEDQNV